MRLLIDFDDRIFWNGIEIAEPVAQVLAAAQRAHVEDITVRGMTD